MTGSYSHCIIILSRRDAESAKKNNDFSAGSASLRLCEKNTKGVIFPGGCIN